MDVEGKQIILPTGETENGKSTPEKNNFSKDFIDTEACRDDFYGHYRDPYFNGKDIDLKDSKTKHVANSERTEPEMSNAEKEELMQYLRVKANGMMSKPVNNNKNSGYKFFGEPKHNPADKDEPKRMGRRIICKPYAFVKKDADCKMIKHNKTGPNKIISIIVTSACILSGISLFIVITRFVDVMSSNNTNEDLEQTESPFPEVCIDCLKLVKNPYKQTDPDELVDGLMKKYENGVLKCCARNHSQISAVLEAMLRDQEMYSDPLLLDSPSVSAHRLMKFEEAITINGGHTNENSHSVLMFDSNNSSTSTEHMRGIKVTEDGFIILFTGIYFVYSNVHFHSRTTKDQTWYSYIHRTRPNNGAGTGVLLKTAHTNCDSCKNGSRETAFTGGVFLLQAGDFIQVTVSKRGLVDFNKESTYLGLIMMGYK